MRMALAEDEALFRQGLTSLLTTGGHDVVVSAADADDLVTQVAAAQPTWSSSTSACRRRTPRRG